MPDARLVVIRRATHNVQGDNPTDSRGSCTRFSRSCPGRGGGGVSREARSGSTRLIERLC